MRVVAVGDCGIDRYVDLGADRPGGISLNFAANALDCFEKGDRIGVLTALGSDREAGVVQRAIDGLGLEGAVARLPGVTPVQYIDHDAGGDRLFVRYDAGVLAAHRIGPAERAVLAGADVTIATVFTKILDFFETVAAAPAGGLRALDYCNLGVAEDPLRYVRRFTRDFDVGFAGIDAGDGALIDALEGIARAEGRLIVATLGPAGSVALGGRTRIHCPAVPVARVVDTTGAGDTFAAGFLSAYARGRDTAAALARGSQAAARTLSQTGAFPAALVPWPADAPAAWAALRRG